jgi:poly(A) polymerase
MIDLWTKDVLRIYNALNGQMRLTGGCVRDYLLNQVPYDIDIATSLLPDEVMKRLLQSDIHAYPIARGHGVVAAEISHQMFEITTLRRDVYSDSGTEQIQFITDYREDAVRRDFTINAMYLDRQNKLYDYVEGQEDLKNKRVRFIGDPNTRIREDPLRMFRYVRFWAQYGGEQPDKTVIELFPKLKVLLPNISAGRLCKEFLKILMCDRVLPAVELMDEIDILSDLMVQVNVEALKAFLQDKPNADAMARLKVLSGGQTTSIWQSFRPNFRK